MQMLQFEEVLPRYQAQDEAVRFIQELSKHWPGAPDFVFYNDLEGAAERLGIDEAVLSKARTLSKKRDIKQGLGVMHPLDCWKLTPRLSRMGRREQFLMAGRVAERFPDEGDAAFSWYTLFGRYSFSRKDQFGHGHGVFADGKGLASEPAAKTWTRVKWHAVGYLIHSLFDGDIAEQIGAFERLPAGREMLLCLALAEIAIPFGHAASSDSTIVRSVLIEDLRDEDRVSSQGERGRVLSCASRSSQEVLELAKAKTAEAVAVSEQLVSVLEKIVDETPDLEQLTEDVSPQMERLKELPLRIPLGWNLWDFLTGRLVAEVCVSRAAQG